MAQQLHSGIQRRAQDNSQGRQRHRSMCLEELEDRRLMNGAYGPQPWITAAETAVVPATWSIQRTDLVQAPADARPTVRVRLQAADLNSNPITRIAIGAPFLLQAYVQDLRDSRAAGAAGDGVFAAYLNVTFDPELVAATARSRDDVAFVGDYQNGRSGEFRTPGLLDQVGAFGGMTPPGPTERLLWSVQRADRA